MLYSLLIANIIANHSAKTRVEIPRLAMSGGTIIALMADEIAMDKNACLGSIDLQMMLPIKSIIPTARKHKDTSIVCSIAYDLMNRYQKDYLSKVKDLVKLKYPKKFGEVLNFFYHRYSHEIPMFFKDMPAVLNVQCLEVSESPAAASSAPKGQGLESMLSMFSGFPVGQGGNTNNTVYY